MLCRGARGKIGDNGRDRSGGSARSKGDGSRHYRSARGICGSTQERVVVGGSIGVSEARLMVTLEKRLEVSSSRGVSASRVVVKRSLEGGKLHSSPVPDVTV